MVLNADAVQYLSIDPSFGPTLHTTDSYSITVSFKPDRLDRWSRIFEFGSTSKQRMHGWCRDGQIVLQPAAAATATATDHIHHTTLVPGDASVGTLFFTPMAYNGAVSYYIARERQGHADACDAGPAPEVNRWYVRTSNDERRRAATGPHIEPADVDSSIHVRGVYTHTRARVPIGTPWP